MMDLLRKGREEAEAIERAVETAEAQEAEAERALTVKAFEAP